MYMTMLKSMHTLNMQHLYMTMLKSMHTLNMHVMDSDTRIHAGEYYSDCSLYISNICEDHTHTHNKLNN